MRRLSRVSGNTFQSDDFDDYFERESRWRRCCHTCGLCLHNSEKGTWCMKRCSDWLFLLIFYTFFFLILGSLFYGVLWFSFNHLVTGNVTHTKTPGLSFTPNVNKPESIIFMKSQPDDYELDYSSYRRSIQFFLDDYRNNNSNSKFELSELGKCLNNHFGYKNRSPCVFIKLNKILNWIPDCYSATELPNEMSGKFRNVVLKNFGNIEAIWLSCDGVTPADRQHIGGISYYPLPGFEKKYFPYTTRDVDYKPPIVAVHFQSIQRGMIVNVECKAWAKNINHESKGHPARFQLYFN